MCRDLIPKAKPFKRTVWVSARSGVPTVPDDYSERMGCHAGLEKVTFPLNARWACDTLPELERQVILRDELSALTPRLRRYARALATGSPAPCEFADDLVQATLMRALGSRYMGGVGDLSIRLYATITQLHRDGAVVGKSAAVAGSGRPALVAGVSLAGPSGAGPNTKVSAGLLSLSVEEREALLLVVLEGFDHGDAARILRISRSVFITRLTQARTNLDQFLRARPAGKMAVRDIPYLRLVN